MRWKHFIYLFILSVLVTGWFATPSTPERGVLKDGFLPSTPEDLFYVWLFAFGWILAIYAAILGAVFLIRKMKST